ncbi:hypothetical protein PFISCL1PPCAC_8490, partial [Pristionchus fissidentatus]
GTVSIHRLYPRPNQLVHFKAVLCSHSPLHQFKGNWRSRGRTSPVHYVRHGQRNGYAEFLIQPKWVLENQQVKVLPGPDKKINNSGIIESLGGDFIDEADSIPD